MKTLSLVVFLAFLIQVASAKVLPGDYAAYKGVLNGQLYTLYRTEVISYDEVTRKTEYKLTEEFADGTRKETIETRETLTDMDGEELIKRCADYGDIYNYALSAQVTIPACRVKDMNNANLYIDAAQVPFGYVLFHDEDGATMELIEYFKN